MDPFIGEIRAFGFGYAPREWMPCEGQLLPISQYSALFSILGTQYGGDGVRTFALPDLRGRAPLGSGQGPGLQGYDVGDAGGDESVTLTEQTVPPHVHTAQAFEARSDNKAAPEPKLALANSEAGTVYDTTAPAPPVTMDPNSIEPAGGGSLPHANMMPTIALTFCIALVGVFPQRP